MSYHQLFNNSQRIIQEQQQYTVTQENYSFPKAPPPLAKNGSYFTFFEQAENVLNIAFLQHPSTFVEERQESFRGSSSTRGGQEPNFDLLSIFFPSERKLDTSPSDIKKKVPQNDSKASARKTKKKIWSESDNALLKEVVCKYKCDWKRIVRRVHRLTKKKYTIHFLKKKFKEFTKDDNIKKGVKFSHEEDLELVKNYRKYGLNWQMISLQMNKRTPLMLKNRFYSFIRKNGVLAKLLKELENVDSECHFLDEITEETSPKYSSTLHDSHFAIEAARITTSVGSSHKEAL